MMYILLHWKLKRTMMMHESNQQLILDQLKSTDIFRDVPDDILSHHIASFQLHTINAGAPILTKGDHGDSMFVILDGEVKVHEHDFVLAHLQRGHYFGEMALLRKLPRNANVRTTQSTKLLILDGVDLHPDARHGRRRIGEEEVARADAERHAARRRARVEALARSRRTGVGETNSVDKLHHQEMPDLRFVGVVRHHDIGVA